MRIFLTGGTGAIGRLLLPRLISAGHDVVALVRNEEKARAVQALAGTPVIADPLSRADLTSAVRNAAPEIIIHQLTSLTGAGNFKKFEKEFALTNRFRTEVTDTLLEAARDVGAQRFIAQSFCGWPFAREGGPIKTEDDPLDANPPAAFRTTMAAIRHLETAVTANRDVTGIALRYGLFYGSGTSIAKGTPILEMVRKRRMPIVGDGAGIWSFIHIEDAAAATAAAVTHGSGGLYNIVDDEPAPVSEWLPHLATVAGAKPPRSIPVWLGRIAIGDAGVAMMTTVRGGSNAKAKRELAWEPRFSSWRQGFMQGL